MKNNNGSGQMEKIRRHEFALEMVMDGFLERVTLKAS